MIKAKKFCNPKQRNELTKILFIVIFRKVSKGKIDRGGKYEMEYYKEEFVIHCSTKKEYEDVLAKIEKDCSLKWCSGKNPTDISSWEGWDEEKTRSCICSLGENDFGLTFGSKEYFEENYSEIEIVKASEFLNS